MINKKTNKGFTLIELIVVVSIILILSGLLVPKVLGYQDKARKAKVVNTGRQIFDASMESYTEEEGHFDVDKLKSSIAAVTDAEIPTTDGVTLAEGSDQSATVKFKSDKKDYTETIAASSNQFIVKEGTNEIYRNK